MVMEVDMAMEMDMVMEDGKIKLSSSVSSFEFVL